MALSFSAGFLLGFSCCDARVLLILVRKEYCLLLNPSRLFQLKIIISESVRAAMLITLKMFCIVFSVRG